MSSLKVSLSLNKLVMSVTFPTHHVFIGHPYVVATVQLLFLAQSWAMYSSTADLSSPPSEKHLIPSGVVCKAMRVILGTLEIE